MVFIFGVFKVRNPEPSTPTPFDTWSIDNHQALCECVEAMIAGCQLDVGGEVSQRVVLGFLGLASTLGDASIDVAVPVRTAFNQALRYWAGLEAGLSIATYAGLTRDQLVEARPVVDGDASLWSVVWCTAQIAAAPYQSPGGLQDCEFEDQHAALSASISLSLVEERRLSLARSMPLGLFEAVRLVSASIQDRTPAAFESWGSRVARRIGRALEALPLADQRDVCATAEGLFYAARSGLAPVPVRLIDEQETLDIGRQYTSGHGALRCVEGAVWDSQSLEVKYLVSDVDLSANAGSPQPAHYSLKSSSKAHREYQPTAKDVRRTRLVSAPVVSASRASAGNVPAWLLG